MASSGMKHGCRPAPLGIGGLLLAALFLFGVPKSNAQVHPYNASTFLSAVPSGSSSLGTPVSSLPAISGGTTICIGTTTSLSNSVAGGTWTSGNTSVATVSATGVVYGVAGGTSIITYTSGTNYTTVLITITYQIAGASSVCVGNVSTLVDTTPTGLWSSSNIVVANVSPLGVVTGMNAGVATITYARTGACAVTKAITVTANTVGAITGATGALQVCTGGTITVGDTTPSGTWSSSNNAMASISGAGVITAGGVAGSATITYSKSGCYQTKPLAINNTSSVGAITGTFSVCAGNVTSLADATTMGTWSLSNTSVATVNTAGVVKGLASGSDTVVYTKGGCSVFQVVTVSANPATPILGNANACVGQNDSLSNATSGGTWSLNYPTLATISATGVLTGIATGNVTVTYTYAGGCYVTKLVAVNAASSVGAISGTFAICQGTGTTLNDAVLGGSWSNLTPLVATVNSYGYVTGIAAGTDTITYTRLGCIASQIITVNPLPAAITTLHGKWAECAPNPYFATTVTDTLANATAGGTWSSSNTALATIGVVGSNGVVYGVSSGISGTGAVVITYQLPTGCYVTAKDTVYGPAAISGGDSVCIAPLTYLIMHDATLGGTWALSNTKASINSSSSTDASFTGVTAGVDTVKYTVTYSGLGCVSAAVITVNAAPGTISGLSTVCAGTTLSLTDTAAGGTWASSNTSLATISASGVVYGVATGAMYVTYTKNGCNVTKAIVVNSAPGAITSTHGSHKICTGLGVDTLTSTTPGGTWSASNGYASLLVTSLYQDTVKVTGVGGSNVYDTIYYNVGGCTVSFIDTIVSNSTLTSITAAAAADVCVGSAITFVSGGGTGTWSTNNTAIASISGSMVHASGNDSAYVSGIAAGMAIVTYTRTSDRCFKTLQVYVNAQPAAIAGASGAALTGIQYVCTNTGAANLVHLTDTLSDPTTGGTWSSSNNTIASVSSTGVVYGIGQGSATITYALPGGCASYQPIDVQPSPRTLRGASSVCTIAPGNVAWIVDTLGTSSSWSTSNASVASVTYYNSDSANLIGVAAGTANITYTIGNCSTYKTVTVGASNPTISGNTTVCAQSTNDTLKGTPTTGSWSMQTLYPAIGTASSSGLTGANAGKYIFVGGAAGSVILTYTNAGCYATTTMTVYANTLNPITGNNAVCVGGNTTLADGASGGVWTSGNTTVATITAGGAMYGVAAGSAIISYGIPNGGCYAFYSINVGNVTPAAIGGGTAPLCQGTTTAMTDATAGGTWTSDNTGVALINAAGVIYGVSGGTANINYTLTGCAPTAVQVTVNALPTLTTATGGGVECAGSSLAFTPSTSGGTWTSSATSIATVDASGVVHGVNAGTTNISYGLASGGTTCYAVFVDTVGASLDTIFGNPTKTHMCGGDTLNVRAGVAKGTWSSSNAGIAGVSFAVGSSSTGVVYANGNGVATITFTSFGNCATATRQDTVTMLGAITGSFSVCKTDSTDLSDATAGGVWSVNNTTLATINSSTGMLYGLLAGNDTVNYIMSGCKVSQPVYIAGCGLREGAQNGGIVTFADQVYTLFPNPSNGNITITQSVSEDGAVPVTVINYAGSVIYKGNVTFNGGKASLNVSGATPGLYMVLLNGSNGSATTLKMLID
jgi:trimeric autotransporter adhesin